MNTMMDAYEKQLKKLFGYSHFRPKQLAFMKLIANGKDILAISPTGSGKSMLYQIPALSETTGVTVVISPLLSNIFEQVEELNRISPGCAHAWSSSTSSSDKQQIVTQLSCDRIRVLVCSPEAFSGPLIEHLSRLQIHVNRVCVDEAHLIAQWGATFRTAYADIGTQIAKLSGSGNVQLIALTATADLHTCSEISKSLNRELVKIAYNPLRDNIRYSLVNLHTKLGPSNSLSLPHSLSLSDMLKASFTANRANSDSREQLINFLIQRISKFNKTLIFCATKTKCDYISDLLASRLTNTVLKYHGGMSRADRERVQQSYTQSNEHDIVLIATNSFGIGVDVPDISQIIHVDAPPSIDAYLQETGRAGRNGCSVDALIVLDNYREFKSSEYLVRSSFPPAESICLLLQQILTEWNDSCGRGFDLKLTKQNSAALRYLVNQGYIEVISSDEDLLTICDIKMLEFKSDDYQRSRQYALNSLSEMKQYASLDNPNELRDFLCQKYDFIDIQPKTEQLSNRLDDRFTSIAEVEKALDEIFRIFCQKQLHCNPKALITKTRVTKLAESLIMNHCVTTNLITTNLKLSKSNEALLFEALVSGLTKR